MQYLPILLNISRKKILIVGGGNVAFLKSRNIRRFTSDITFLALDFNEDIHNPGNTLIMKAYESEDLDLFDIVYACTNNKELNLKIRNDANKRGILVSVCDNPQISDFGSTATCKINNVTISVGTNGTDVKKSIAIRNKIQELIDNNILKID
ncbi:MAG: bifunctional precorrin-2 dehydrogenase/sirohydrochlorin ferrochelatase [Dysgonomonas sp.]